MLRGYCLQVVVDFPLTYMTADNKLAAQVAISNVHSSGGTNLSGGLFKGIDQHQQQSPPQATVEQPTEQPDAATGQPSWGALDCLVFVT